MEGPHSQESPNSKEKDKQLLLEQYKLMVSTADTASDRRSRNNQLYLSLTTFLISVSSFLTQVGETQPWHYVIWIGLSIAGVLICLLWYVNIRSFRQLNSGKYQVILELEKQLPAQPFQREWEILGEGQDNKRFIRFTKIEAYIPIILMILFVWMMGYLAWNLFE
ncbi:MAG: hypothetical protein AAF135_23125 [Bacteroidota bacterium]